MKPNEKYTYVLEINRFGKKENRECSDLLQLVTKYRRKSNSLMKARDKATTETIILSCETFLNLVEQQFAEEVALIEHPGVFVFEAEGTEHFKKIKVLRDILYKIPRAHLCTCPDEVVFRWNVIAYYANWLTTDYSTSPVSQVA